MSTGTKYIGIYGENKDNIELDKTYTFTIENRGVQASGYELYLENDSSITGDLSSITYNISGDLSQNGTLNSSSERKLISGLLADGDKKTITLTLSSTNIKTYKGKLKIKYTNYEYLQNYDYTGDYQTFTAPASGTYKIELWGAQGGSISGTAYNSDGTVRAENLTYTGGGGAYTTGEIDLKKNQKFYIYVGSTPSSTNTTLSYANGTYIGGYNGGASLTSGQERFGSPGGGAIDIRLISGTWDDFDSLKSRIMVAAGGGGANFRNEGYGEGNGGYGGALTGGDGLEALTPGSYFRGDYAYGYNIGKGATQIAGGYVEKHLLNGDITNLTAGLGTFGGKEAALGQSGGGSGYYSGGSNSHGGAGGGSSYISGYLGCNAIKEMSTMDNIVHTGQPNHYSGYIFKNSSMLAGDESIPNKNQSENSTIGNSENGYAKVTFVSFS